jgi:hypothetical protein
MIPHTRTARFLTAIAGNEATIRIPAQHPLVRNARAPSFLGIEAGAQAAAAMSQGSGGQPKSGRLVRVREAVFSMQEIPAETDLRVVATLEAAAPPLAIYRIELYVGDVEAMHATIATHQS